MKSAFYNNYMLADGPQTVSCISPALPQDYDRQRSWFALAVPALMGFLLAIVPLIGTAAAVPTLVVLVGLLLWTAFRDTERALYIFFAWCWMDGTIRGVCGSSIAIILGRDIVLFVVAIGWALQRRYTALNNPLRLPPGTLLVALFVIDCLLQIANPGSAGLIPTLVGLKAHLAPLCLIFIGYDVFRRPEQVRSFFIFLTFATLAISCVSLIQYQQGPSWTYAHFPGTQLVISQDASDNPDAGSVENSGFKPPGTTTFGGGTNTYISLVLPITFVLLLLSGKLRFSKAAKSVFVATLLVFVIALFINGVRSGLVTGAVCVLLTTLLVGGRQKVRAGFALGVCFVLAIGAFSISQNVSSGHTAERYGTTLANPVAALHDDRKTFFDQFTELVTQVPLGEGLGKITPNAGQFLAPSQRKDIHSSEAYLGSMISETGVFGASLIFMVALLFLVRGFLVLRNAQDDDNRLLGAALLAILGVLVMNFFVTPILFQPPGSVMFWLGGAMLLRAFTPTKQSLPNITPEHEIIR